MSYNFNERIWRWDDNNNTKPIEMTVALPSLNGSEIIWLALASLRRQTDIDFAWELIVFEEDGVSKEIVKKYQSKLPGCVRIIYKTITREDAFYTLEDITKNKCTSYYTLLEKWINISKCADKNSKIFVKHANDDYSPPKRLSIHYEHFKNDNCYYSTQRKGYFYDIKTDKWMLYDASNYDVSKNHLNMALRTSLMRKIPLSEKPLRSCIDSYIFKNLVKLNDLNPNKEKIIFNDDEIDSNNWKSGLFTDGFNTISKGRRLFYKSKETVIQKKGKAHKFMSEVPNQNYPSSLTSVPYQILKRLKIMGNKYRNSSIISLEDSK